MQSRMLWAYRAVFKQTAGGGGIIVVNFNSTERYELLYAQIGNNDYAANRVVQVTLLDSASTIITYLLNISTVDNLRLIFPIQDISTSTTNDGSFFERTIKIGSEDSIKANTDALAQNEELTIVMRALIQTTKPIITTTGSTGTVTTTTTYDRVI